MIIENVLRKAKAKAEKAKKKLIEIDKKQPWLKYIAIACGGYAIYRIGVHRGCNDAARANVDCIKQTYPETYDIIVGKKAFENKDFAKNFVNNVAEKAFDHDGAHWAAYKHTWTENYRENFEKLVEFAKGLDMKPCECLSVGYYVDPNSDKDVFCKYLQQQCRNSGYIRASLN